MGIALYRPLEARTPDSIRTDLASASSWTRFISDRLSVAICLSTNFALNAVSKANAAFPYGDLARPKVVEVVNDRSEQTSQEPLAKRRSSRSLRLNEQCRNR